MANIQEAMQYAYDNPSSDFAKNFEKLASSGALDNEAKNYGIDLTPFKPVQEKTTMQKVGDVAGSIINAPERLGNAVLNVAGKGINAASVALGGEANPHLAPQAQRTGLFGNTVDTLGYKDGQALQGTELAKDVAGNVAQNASLLVPGGVGFKGASLGAKVLKGVGVGATTGGLQGAGLALQDQKDASGILSDTLKGAAIGGVVGGAFPLVPAVAKLPSKAKDSVSKNFTKKGDEFVLDLISPKATESIKQEALQQGRVTEPGFFKAGKITASKRDEQVAEAVKDFVSKKATPVQNIDSISNGVKAINTGVKAYVKENKVPFNTTQLTSQLNKGKEELNLIFASDTNAKKTYDAVVKEFIKHVKSKDTSGLLDARQEFDKIPAIKKLLDSQGLGENTRKEIVLTTRSMANKYISDLLPKGNQYRETLLKEHKMIEALGNIADKNTSIIDANKLQLLTKEYPILKWVVSGLAGAAGIGVGGTIIGSSN